MRPDPKLRNALASIAADFATQLIAMLREGSIGDAADLAVSRSSGGRRAEPTSASTKRPGRPKKTSKPAPSERTPGVAARIAEVVRFVVQHPGCSVGDVEKAIGENERTTRRTLADAVAEGSIVRIGAGPKTRYRAAGSR